MLPSTVQKLVFTASIDGNGTMGNISGFDVTITQDGREPLLLHMTGADFSAEKAIISIELYIKTEWRYSAVAMGFNGGLSDLLAYYGGQEVSDDNSAPQQKDTFSQNSAPSPAPVLSDMPYQQPVNNARQQSAYIPPVQPVQQQEPVQKSETQSSPAKVSLKKLSDKPVSLKKDEKVELRKQTEFIDEVIEDFVVGLGWDPADVGTRIDCDSSVFLCQGGKLRDKDIICFLRKKHSSRAVIHHGDNLTGYGDGDDEQIEIHLRKLPREYDRIVIVVNIFMSDVSHLHFGNVRNCYMRMCDTRGMELLRYTLSDNFEYNGMPAMIFGEFTKENGVWIFHAIGQGTPDNSIDELANRFRY